ncbi:MAG: hypothetical protein IT425_03080 [Pirellulales bacterium]|nr:hypothetical protein [Pirellulales bacterium]
MIFKGKYIDGQNVEFAAKQASCVEPRAIGKLDLSAIARVYLNFATPSIFCFADGIGLKRLGFKDQLMSFVADCPVALLGAIMVIVLVQSSMDASDNHNFSSLSSAK